MASLNLLTSFLDFARNIHLFPASVRQLNLQFHYEPPRDQNYAPPDITEDGMDLLSPRLRGFSQRLERLSINESVVVGPEIFWAFNPQGDSFIELPYWPNLIDVPDTALASQEAASIAQVADIAPARNGRANAAKGAQKIVGLRC